MDKRLFFALWPDEQSRRQVDSINHSLHHSGRRLRPQNLHITLFFIGNIDIAWLDSILAAASQIKAKSIQLEFNELDCWKRPRILCLICQRQPMALYQLVNQLTHAMAMLPIRQVTRPFRAHITLARKATQKPVNPSFTSVSMNFEDFVLVESLSTDDGVQYRVLQRWPLNGG